MLGAYRWAGEEVFKAELMVGESMDTRLCKHTVHLGEEGKASVRSSVDGHLLGCGYQPSLPI